MLDSTPSASPLRDRSPWTCSSPPACASATPSCPSTSSEAAVPNSDEDSDAALHPRLRRQKRKARRKALALCHAQLQPLHSDGVPSPHELDDDAAIPGEIRTAPSPSRPAAALPPSSPSLDDMPHKPSSPARASPVLTPSLSRRHSRSTPLSPSKRRHSATVAAATSPPNAAVADSPETLRVPIYPGQTLVFGRKPCLASLPPIPGSNSLSHAIHPLRLPSSFTHASRTHCTCTLTAPPLGGLTLTVTVVGMNGVQVDDERFEKGMSAGVELKRRDGEEIELGFFGGKRVMCEVKLEEVGGSGRATRGKRQGSGNNQTSPAPLLRVDLKRKAALASQARNVLSNDVGPFITDDTTLGSPTKRFRPMEVSTEPLDASIRRLPMSDRARAAITSLDLDMTSILCAALVFAPRATVATTEAIRSVLEIQPRMRDVVTPRNSPSAPTRPIANESAINPRNDDSRDNLEPDEDMKVAKIEDVGSESLQSEHSPVEGQARGVGGDDVEEEEEEEQDVTTEAAVEAWREVILEALNEYRQDDGQGMFGHISNQGLKDASGESLEALWYYQPTRDTNFDRRARLGPYVKKLRHTQTTSKQYFFKKVRGTRRKS